MTYNKNSLKKRIKRTDSKKSKIKNKIGLSSLQIGLIAFIVLIVVICSGVLGIAKGIIDSAPDISGMDVVPTGYSTTVFADDGTTEIATLVGSGANREYVTLDKIPKHMQQAFVAIEDARFYEHNGIDLQGVARAGVATVKKLLTGNGKIQGASTITQQLIKNNVLVSWTEEKNFVEKLQRKIQEQYLAIKLEEQVNDKDWILENYLNTINLGSNTLGVQAASNKYFGKDVSELTLSESAVIAGITQNPYGYDPIRFPDNNKERRVRVLDAMKEQEYITQEQYDEAMADPVYDRIASYNVENPSSYNTYFVDALIDDVLDDLINKAGYTESDAYKAIYQGGLTIISTQDINIQTICDEEANNQKHFNYKPSYSFNMSFSVKKADGTTKNHTQYSMQSYYKKLYNKTEYSITYKTEEACYEAIKKYQEDILEEGDTIVEGTESITLTLQPQVAMTVIDQSTGEVKAVVGGRGDKTGNRTWNRATNTKRQPGSTFKMMTCYPALIDTDTGTLATVYDDAPLTIGDKEYKNSTEGAFYGWTTAREGIMHSFNITAIKAAQDVGLRTCYEYALKFGFSTLTEADSQIAGLPLGGITNGVTNLELTAGYATIANQGEYIEPSFYTAVYDHDGNLILDNTTQERHEAISKETAFLLTDAMCDVMTAGTGGGAYFGSSMAQAGKSGTTTANRDILFAGFTPYYTCVVWGGHDDNTEQKNEYMYIRNIWRESMKRIHKDLEYKSFEKPSGITKAEVCMDSGLVPLEEVCELCIKGNPIYEEYFKVGTVPTETCDHHVELDICSATGLIANANCPEEGIEKKVFIIGSDPETNDAEYIATEEFLATICTHQATEKPDSQKPDSNKPDSEKPDSNKPDNENPDDENSEGENSGNENSGNENSNTGNSDNGNSNGNNQGGSNNGSNN